MPEDYVYVPVWLLVLLIFLASGAVQYALISAVKLVIHLDRPRQEKVDPQGGKILRLSDVRDEPRVSAGKEG